MARLRVTFIDVGWGDSILIEAIDDLGHRSFGLVDSNDTPHDRSSYLFVKRYLQRESIPFGRGSRVFDFVMLSHGHADHGQGLKNMMSAFGTDAFWYPESGALSITPRLLLYARKAKSRVGSLSKIDSSVPLPSLGPASLRALHPSAGAVNSNENLNSIVLVVSLDNVSMVLTADAEASAWPAISAHPVTGLQVFQVPHHGAKNGTFHGSSTPWLNALSGSERLVASCHREPFSHPHPDVITALSATSHPVYRTDRHLSITFETDGNRVDTIYHH